MNSVILNALSVLVLVFFTMNGIRAAESDTSQSKGFGSFFNNVENALKGVKKLPNKMEEALSEKKQKSTELANEEDSVAKAQLSTPQKVKIKEPSESNESKALVKQVQQLLNAKGFDAGVADGIPGERTRDAICQFQIAVDQKPDPRATLELRKILSDPAVKMKTREYSELMKAKCDVAHFNNLNNLDAAEIHNYEGVLADTDPLCRTLVAPYKMDSNLKIFTDPAKKSLPKASSMVKGLLKKEKPEVNFDISMEDLRETAKRANWMPFSMEKSYGAAIHQKRMMLADDYRILPRNSPRSDIKDLYQKADKIMANILRSVGEKHPYSFQIFVVDNTIPNAEALPGGYLYVNRGVFEADYADLIIGHEISHVFQRHITMELQARLIDTVETTEELRQLVEKKNTEAFITKLLGLRGAMIKYSQNQELQSDACSVRLIARRFDDFSGPVNAFVADMKKHSVSMLDVGVSHPGYPLRMKRLLEISKQLAAH